MDTSNAITPATPVDETKSNDGKKPTIERKKLSVGLDINQLNKIEQFKSEYLNQINKSNDRLSSHQSIRGTRCATRFKINTSNLLNLKQNQVKSMAQTHTISPQSPGPKTPIGATVDTAESTKSNFKTKSTP